MSKRDDKPNKYNRTRINLDDSSKLNNILNHYHNIRVMVEELKK